MSDIGTKRVVVEFPLPLYNALYSIVEADDTTDISKTIRGLAHELVEKHKKTPGSKPKVIRRKRT